MIQDIVSIQISLQHDTVDFIGKNLSKGKKGTVLHYVSNIGAYAIANN